MDLSTCTHFLRSFAWETTTLPFCLHWFQAGKGWFFAVAGTNTLTLFNTTSCHCQGWQKGNLSLLSKSIPSGWRNGAVGEPSRIVLCPGIPECSEHFTTNITLSCTLLLICFLISLLFPVTRSCLDLYSSWFLPPIHTCVPP